MSLPISNPNKTPIVLLGIAVWHGLLAIGGVIGAIVMWQAQVDNPTLVKSLGVTALVLFAAASAFTVFLVLRRMHSGRALSLTINYLGFLFCLLGGMHALGLFTGIDSLAGTFGKGIPYLLGVFAGYLVSAFGDRFENYPARQRMFQQAGRLIIIAFLIIFLFAIGIVPGFLSLISKLNALSPNWIGHRHTVVCRDDCCNVVQVICRCSGCQKPA